MLFFAAIVVVTGCSPVTFGQGSADVRIVGGEPFTWDPARAGDSGSANVIAQVFEGLTAFDAESNVQPALADSWQASEDGRQITFHLRPGILYSDGTPITADDVVASWLRIIDPVQPSPLASIVSDIEGAVEYQAGQIQADEVGLRADGDNVVVNLRRPATYFVSVTASPSLAVYPRSEFSRSPQVPVVVSGAYVPSVALGGAIHLSGNSNYWDGPPPLAEVDLVTDLGDEDPLSAFQSGTIDLTGVSSNDASWIQYDQTLGPDLRHSTDFTVSYYGFDTRVPPFDSAQVRLAFAKAVDWDRIVRLSGAPVATSLVPAGVPGRDEEDHRPTYDPEAAQQLLADASYPNGEGFPTVILGTYGVGYELTVAEELETNLGVHVEIEAQDFREYVGRPRGPGSPGIFTMAWSADYPHPHDFLGLLLETGSTSNEGAWSNAEYDALLEQAAATDDLDEQETLYAQAQEILEIEAPVVAAAYGESWALAREGLLGAVESGVGIIRIAGSGLGSRARAVRRLVRLVGALVIGTALSAGVLAAPRSAFAQGPTFGEPVGTAPIGGPLTVTSSIDGVNGGSVELLVRLEGTKPQIVIPATPGEAQGQWQVQAEIDVATSSLCTCHFDGTSPPNTKIEFQFRVRSVDGTDALGPVGRVTVEDDRFEWRTLEQDLVRVHWYEGDEASAQQAADVANEAIDRAAELLGTTLPKPVDLFVYATQQAMVEAVDPTRESIAGQADPTTDTMVICATCGGPQEAEVTVAHELTHLVFDETTANPYHEPPRWLNEGIATYLSEGYSNVYVGVVNDAAQADTLIPLEGLAGLFPSQYEAFLPRVRRERVCRRLFREHVQRGDSLGPRAELRRRHVR